MGGHVRTPVQAPDYTGVQLQTSAMSLPVPLAWGLSRGSPNLIYYTDYKVHKKQVGKGGAGGGKQTEYTYSATFIDAICEGPIAGIRTTYVNSGALSGFALAGFSLFPGATPQTPWSYLTANHPADALGYQGIAYVAAANYNLGQSASIPSLSFEVQAPLYNTQVGGAGDADPAQVASDFLTNAQYGANFPTARIDNATLMSSGAAPTTGDSAYQTYCRAMGFGISPFIQNQEAGVDILARWMQVTNAAAVWCGYTLKFIPYGDETVTGNGVTYIPPTAAVFAFGDDDYLQDGDKDPVEVNVRDWFEAKNAIAIECRIREYQYNSVPIDWIDQSVSELVGRRQAGTIQAHEICETAMATKVVSLIGQRMLYVRATYSFKVGPEHILVEPMDVGTLTDSRLGLAAVPVRIQSVEEQDDGTLAIVAQEFPGTTGAATPAALSGPQAAILNSQVAPDPVNPPIVFEPTSAACAFLNNGQAAPLIVALVSGGSGGAYDPNWGGCIVNVSTDGTTYVPLADVGGSTRITQPASMGVLTANLAAYSGANPDTTDTLAVSLVESNGALVSASSAATAAAGATLGVIQDSGGAVELIGPQTATLTGANAYSLTSLYRGLFGTAAGAHVSGALYGRLDGSVFVAALPAAYVGQTLYFKFQSLNIWGNAVQDLATCTAYSYTPTGAGFAGAGQASGAPAPAPSAIPANSLVNIYSHGGVPSLRLADATTAGQQAHAFITTAVAAGASAVPYYRGALGGFSGLTIGAPCWLAPGGGVTQAAPSSSGNLVQPVGVATSATTIDFAYHPPTDIVP
jgi:hypothetical protein